MKPHLAQFYSPSIDKYFHWDNGMFIFDGEWIEYLEPVNDLVAI